MKTRKLGGTGIDVTEICLGTMTWGHQNSEAEAHAQMDYAMGEGVTFWDTAEVYPIPARAEFSGRTESYMGTWFAKTGRRKDVVLATKVTPARPWIRGGAPTSPAVIREAIEGSLTRLQTDYVDLYQVHRPNRPYPHHQNHWTYAPTVDAAKEVEELHAVLQTMGDLIKEGKIRSFGLSNDTAWGVMTYLRLAEKFSLPRVASAQNEYSLLYRWDDNYMEEVLTYENVAYLPYSPLACGMLAGKYMDGQRPHGTRWSIPNNGSDGRDSELSREASRAYVALAVQHGLDPCQMAIAWTLTRPFVTSTIIGATSVEQLKTDIAAAKVVLSDEVLKEIAGLRKVYPASY